MQTTYRNAAQGTSPDKPTLVFDTDGTMLIENMTEEPGPNPKEPGIIPNPLLVDIIKAALAANYAVIIATSGVRTTDGIKGFLQDALSPTELAKIEFKRKEALIACLRQGSEEVPIIPVMVFDDNASVDDYLHDYKIHGRVEMTGDVSINGKMVSCDQILEKIGLKIAALPFPSTNPVHN